MLSRAQEMMSALRTLGSEALMLFQQSFQHEPAATLQKLTGFAPDLLAAGNFNYLLLAAPGTVNLLDLQVPVLANWDDPLGLLVAYATYPKVQSLWNDPPPPRPWRWVDRLIGRPSYLPRPAYFERLTAAPWIQHVSWDTGHIEAFTSLGLARRQSVRWEPVVVSGQFIEYGKNAAQVVHRYDVGFCGNLYNHSMVQHPCWQNEFLRHLIHRIVECKEANLERSCWDLIHAALDELPGDLLREKGLTSDRKPFWDLYFFLAWTVLNAEVRLHVLSQINRDVHIFGMFADPDTVGLMQKHPHLRYGGNVDYVTELPGVYASVKVNVCISNGLIYRGTPSKLLDCLASGGFALCDPKQDLVRLFGPTVERIFFRNAAELNERIDYFLARPTERAELVRYFQSIIFDRCTLVGYLDRVLPLTQRLRRAG
jgi:hypothetical protein